MLASTISGAVSAASCANAGIAAIAAANTAPPSSGPAARERFGIFMIAISMGGPCRSERVGVCFAGADAHGLINAVDEDLAVADLPGLGRAGDRLHGLVDEVGADGDLDLHLGKKGNGVFRAAIDFRVTL